MGLFTRPRRPNANLIRMLADIREFACTAATNTAHMIRQLEELKEIIVTDPGRGPDTDVNDPDEPAQPDGPRQPAEPDTDDTSRDGRRR